MEYFKGEIFKDISQNAYKRMMHCFSPTYKSYKSGEEIWEYEGMKNYIGIVQYGQLVIARIDENGNRVILEGIGANAVFGHRLSFYQAGKDSVEALCTKDCEIMYIDFCHVTKQCTNACAHHSILVENIFDLMVNRAINLSTRIDILSQRTTREKIMCYFRFCANGNAEFMLPLSLSAMAEYLCVDRSAMMRELKKLREDKVIEQEHKKVRLLS